MKVALVVNRVTTDRERNVAEILARLDQAARQGAELILFPEAAVTGLLNNDDPEHDLPLGETILGPSSITLARNARRLRVWMGIGMLEREGDVLYDTAILIAPDGDIALKYRRVQSQWHGPDADPEVYRQGREVVTVETPFGSVGFLICGDLFSNNIVGALNGLEPDLILVPFARCFDDGSYDQARWDREELPSYLDRVAHLGRTTLMTNYLAAPTLMGGAFGGAYIISADGTLQASLPLGQQGLLIANLEEE